VSERAVPRAALSRLRSLGGVIFLRAAPVFSVARASTMSTMTVAQKLTAEAFLALDDPRRGLQLIEGEIVVNQPGMPHQMVLLDLIVALRAWSDAGPDRGRVVLPLDVRLDEHNVYAPDILWYADGRVPALHTRAPYPLPDLAVEVRSPSTWRYDVGVKRAVYEREGLLELWLVDTHAASVLVFRRSSSRARGFDVALELDTEETLVSPLLPDFAIAIAAMFTATS